MSLNTVKALLIINAKAMKCSECGGKMKNGKCSKCDMTANAKKGWSDIARKKAALVRKAAKKGTKSGPKAGVTSKANKFNDKTASKRKDHLRGRKLADLAFKHEDKAGNSGSFADHQRAAKAHAAAASHFKKTGDSKKAAYHERKMKKFKGGGMKYRGTSDGMGGTY